jgi:hypothetical protein
VNVLALDLGTRTGWALSEGGRIESGVQVFDVKRGESPGTRYLRFNRWLDDFTLREMSTFPQYESIRRPRVDLVIYEQTHMRGGAATEVAAGFATRVQEFCARHGIEHASLHSATLKKFTTGSGRGDKGAMQTAAFKRGWIPWTKDDNEVDAICLLHYALAELVPAEREPPGA